MDGIISNPWDSMAKQQILIQLISLVTEILSITQYQSLGYTNCNRFFHNLVVWSFRSWIWSLIFHALKFVSLFLLRWNGEWVPRILNRSSPVEWEVDRRDEPMRRRTPARKHYEYGRFWFNTVISELTYYWTHTVVSDTKNIVATTITTLC